MCRGFDKTYNSHAVPETNHGQDQDPYVITFFITVLVISETIRLSNIAE